MIFEEEDGLVVKERWSFEILALKFESLLIVNWYFSK